MWIQNGRPRGIACISYMEYKLAKSEFRELHRKAVALHLKELDEQINTAAEVDSKRFWRLIKSRRSKTGPSSASEINFNGIMYRDSQEINEQWGVHYANLYTPDNDESFDIK